MSAELDEFIQICDSNGGIGAEAGNKFFETLDFAVHASDYERLDPFSDSYYAYQISLYERISGRKLDQSEFEQTSVNIDFHAAGNNPYHNIPPAMAAFHLLRIAKLFRLAEVPFNGRVLDMGAGWGMTSEIGAYLGCRVTALDINPQFIELIKRRAAKSGLPIEGTVSSFEEYSSDEPFDMIMFYECLHHATKPWTLISQLAGMLKPGGCIGLAGEPINDYWWPSWGLRLDPVSVYCIRKFGWFESGWSLSFINDCFTRAGLIPQFTEDADLGIGPLIIARKPS